MIFVRFKILALITLSLLGCKRSEMSKEELHSFILDESNGLHRTHETNNMEVDVVYKPHELILDQEIEDRTVTGNQIDSIRRKLMPYDYFVFKISSDGQEVLNRYGHDPVLFEKGLNYLSFDVAKDIIMIYKDDTIPAQDALYFRDHGSNNGSEILVAFESGLCQKAPATTQLVFHDRFFGTGINEFEFNTQSFKDIPHLRLTK